MALRPDSPAVGTVSQPGSPDQPGEAGGGRRLAWWRLRSWKTDLDLLTRLRDGLRALPDEVDDGQPGAAQRYRGGGHPAAAPVALADAPAPTSTSAPTSTPVSAAAASAPARPEVILPEIPPVPGSAPPGGLALPPPPCGPALPPPPCGLASPPPLPGEPQQAGAGEPGGPPGAGHPDASSLGPGGQGPESADVPAGQDPAPVSLVKLVSPAGPAGPAVAGEDPVAAICAIQETFARMVAAGDDAAAYFYGWLFSHQPRLRLLFPPAMDEQRDRLLTALARIVEGMSTPEEMAVYLGQLGRDHRKYSVQPEMYEVVGNALIATLRAFAGGAFTPAAEEAWIQAYSAASAIMIRAAEEASATAPAYWSAELVESEQRAAGIAVLTVAPDQELRYAPGQHITVQTPRWPNVWRPYSIACTERDDGLIKLHVKAVPGGWVSNALVHHTVPGDELILGPPLGTMTLQHAAGRDVLCVAGGTGLSPLKAITEQVIKESATGARRKVFLFYGARRREELYDLRDLWRLADAYDGLELTPVTSDDPAFDGMQGNVGRVAARYMPHAECETYLSGPAAMVRDSLRALSRAGIPRERIHFDDALLAGHKRVGSGT